MGKPEYPEYVWGCSFSKALSYTSTFRVVKECKWIIKDFFYFIDVALTIIVPRGISAFWALKYERLGANVIIDGETFSNSEIIAREMSHAENRTFIR